MMQKILQQLNREVGVKGSMIVSPDGLVIMAELGESLEQETVAAVASNTINTIKRALASLGSEKFDRFILISAHGRMVFVDIDSSYLLVVTDKDMNIDFTLLEIDGAAHRIRNASKIE